MIGRIFRAQPRPVFLVIAALAPQAIAHPIPDVLVNTAFQPSGEATITVELDPRCFEEDPETAPYVLAKDFESYAQEARAGLIRKATAFIPSAVEFEFKPGGKVAPEFTVEFVTKPGEGLEDAGDVIFLSATANLQLPEAATAYRIHAIERGYLTVMFFNKLAGVPVKRFQALFPGETSYWLDLRAGAPEAGAQLPVGAAPPNGSRWILFVITAALALLGVWWIARRASPSP